MIPEKGNSSLSESKKRARILCIDTDKTYLNKIQQILVSNGFDSIAASSLGEALELLVSKTPEIILTEIFFPNIEPLDYLRALKKQNPEPVIVVLTKMVERREATDRRLGTIFEFINKNIASHELIGHLKRALLFYREKSSLTNLFDQSEVRMKNQLEWLLWKENHKFLDKVFLGKTLIANVKNSILQGMGIGSLVTYIELLELQGKKEGDKICFQQSALDNIKHSAHVVHEWLENMDYIRMSFEAKFAVEDVKPAEMDEAIRFAIIKIEELRQIKNQEILFDGFSLPFSIACNKKAIYEVMIEIFTNALKFSPPETKIHVTDYRSGNSVALAILNDILPMKGGVPGVPEEYESQIFEPFFKLNNVYDERFHSEKWSMGTGLTIAQHYVHQLGGKIYVYEIIDHATSSTAKKRVVTEIILSIKSRV
ncbi:MAG: response regulator [Leptospiraceae bacterium]|nr:response regulator [Leptospiraceae bacterium]